MKTASNRALPALAVALAAALSAACGGGSGSEAIAPGDVGPQGPPPPATDLIEIQVFDGRDGPLAEAMVHGWVELSSGGGYSLGWASGGKAATTDAAGKVLIDAPPGATLMLTAAKGDYIQSCAAIATAQPGVPVKLELIALDRALAAALAPEPLAAAGIRTVSGQVYELVDGARRPVAGASLWFGDSMGFNYVWTVSDRQGRYLACNLPPFPGWRWGTELWAQQTGYADTIIQAVDSSRTVVVDVEMKRR